MNGSDQERGPCVVTPHSRTVPVQVVFGSADAGTQRFAPFLDEAAMLGDVPAVHLVGRLGGEGAEFASVWMHPDTSTERTHRVFAWMWSQVDLWTAWGRAAVGLGPEYLSRTVDAAVPRDEPAALPMLDILQADRFGDAGTMPLPMDAPFGDEDDVEDPGTLYCGCRDEGHGREKTFLVAMYHADARARPFFALRYSKASERDRVWDWMQHQTGRYGEFKEHFFEHDADSLRKLIYRGMLETERSVRKAGMGSGGMRPLRFWPGPDEAARDG